MYISIPADFYYTKEIEGSGYTVKPTGSLDPQRIIAQKNDYWVDTHPGVAKQPKKLILTDLFFNDVKNDEKIEIIRQLLNAKPCHFAICYINKGQVVPLGLEHINQALFLEISPLSRQEVEAILIDHGEPLETIAYLDSYQFERLTGEASEKPGYRKSSLELSDRNESSIHKIFFSYYPDATIISDNFNRWVNNSVETEYRALSVCIADIKELMANGVINFNTASFQWQQLATIEHLQIIYEDGLDIVCDSLVDEVYGLVKQMPKLKHITFDDIITVNNKWINILQGLETISIRSPICEKELEKLLNVNPELRKLNVGVDYNCSIVNITTPLKALRIINIEGSRLYISREPGYNEFNSHFIRSLVNACPNLNTLNISSFSLEAEILGDEDGLLHLSRLKFIDCSISYVFLCSFLQTATNLKNLKLLNTELNNLDEFHLRKNSLLHLRFIRIHNCNTTSQFLNTLLSAAPNVQELAFTDDEVYSEDPVCFQMNYLEKLGKLEDLIIDAGCTETGYLCSLLSVVPNIKNLNLNYFDCAEKFTDFPAADLKSLKKLTFGKCEIFGGLARFLVTSLPYIEELELRDSLIHKTVKFPDNTCTKLKKLTINQDESVSYNIFEQLLCSNDITNLKLSDCYINYIWANPKLKHYRDLVGVPVSTGDKPNLNMPCNIDANTMDGDETFDVDRKIWVFNGDHPDPSDYRLTSYNRLEIIAKPSSIEDVFVLNNSDDLMLCPCTGINTCPSAFSQQENKYQKNRNASFYKGKLKLKPHQEWQALPSLSVIDEITHIKFASPVDYQLAYSQRDSQYYIRQTGEYAVPVDIEYLFSISQSFNNESVLPQEIKSELQSFRKFGAGSLALPPNKLLSGEEYVKELMLQKKGACRHRAVLFKLWLDREHSAIAARVIINDVHAFVEIRMNGRWIQCDLWGYSAKINISDSEQFSTDFSIEAGMQTDTDHNMLDDESWVDSIFNDNSSDRNVIAPDSSNLSIQDMEQVEAHKKQFRPFFEKPDNKINEREWLEQLSEDTTQKRLIRAQNMSQQNHCLLHIYSYLKAVKQPVFLVESPDDLYCSIPFIERSKDNIGVIKQPPGGLLHDFLHTPHQSRKAPVLLINYAAFKPQDIIRFNSLLDDTRQADGVRIPEHYKIIGVQDTAHPGYYAGADFSSRFVDIIDYPFKTPADELVVSGLSNITDDPYYINLFNSSNWKQRLCGGWKLTAQGLLFVEGELVNALNSKKAITILNGPATNPDYQFFWKKLAVDKQFEGIPVNMNGIQHQQGYDWKLLAEQCHFSKDTQAFNQNSTRYILTSQSFARLFNDYVISNDGRLYEIPGVLVKLSLEQHKQIDILLAGELTKDQWGALLSYASKEHIKLDISLLSHIKLPEELSAYLSQIPEASPCTAPCFIISTDNDVTVMELVKKSENAKVIDISELTSTDLLNKVSASFESQNMKIKFSEQKQYLADELEKGIVFILKGAFAPELLSDLLPYVRQYAVQLRLVSEDAAIFKPFSPLIHQFDIQQKMAQLTCQKTMLACFSQQGLDTLTMSGLMALANYQLEHPLNSDIHAPWSGIYSLAKLKEKTVVFNFETSVEQASAFFKQREIQLDKALANYPMVIISGLTGVGKSTFIDKHYANNRNVYFGEKLIIEWAKNTDGAYLFIDEANINQRDWSEFEGLFNASPYILIDGVYYPLSDKHKVIFAANPLSYGGSRCLASLFERHGNSIIFDPLSKAVIYEHILRPIFKNLDPLMSQILSAKLLEIYDFLIELSTDNVLITPRQIKSIAMLTLAKCANHPNLNPQIVLLEHGYAILTSMIPKEHVNDFINHFPVYFTTSENDNIALAQNFLLTPSRKPVYQAIQSLLMLRNYRRENSQVLNDDQLYGDLCALTLESMPGLGKTELLQAIMHDKKLERLDHDRISNHEDNGYYLLPVSNSLEKKEAILRKAFKEGNIVIIDEINSSPMMERLVNALLMGKTPEGDLPNQPGFLLLGTQNPVTLGSRQKQTAAQMHRMIKLNLSDYPNDEMKDILAFIGLDKLKTHALLDIFKAQQAREAITFRQLLHYAKRIINSQSISEITYHDETLNDEPEDGLLTLGSVTRNPFTLFQSATPDNLMREQSEMRGQKRKRNNEQPVAITQLDLLAPDVLSNNDDEELPRAKRPNYL